MKWDPPRVVVKEEEGLWKGKGREGRRRSTPPPPPPQGAYAAVKGGMSPCTQTLQKRTRSIARTHFVDRTHFIERTRSIHPLPPMSHKDTTFCSKTLLNSLQSHFFLFGLQEMHHFLLRKGNTFYGRKRTHSIELTNSMRMRCMGTDTKHSARIFSCHRNAFSVVIKLNNSRPGLGFRD
jgi:hypothetical protein